MKCQWELAYDEITAYWPMKINSKGNKCVRAVGKAEFCPVHKHMRIVPHDKNLQPVEIEKEVLP